VKNTDDPFLFLILIKVWLIETLKYYTELATLKYGKLIIVVIIIIFL
jgi:hypothetical protein